MIKFLLAFIPAVILFFVSPFQNSEEKLKVTANYPAVIKPGEEFTVTLNVHKSKISGTARLQQYLPNGFTAFEIESHGADFIFEEQNVKFLWSTVPQDEDFTISYKVKTEGNISGFKVINGLFVYIDDEKTIREAIPPIEIKFDSDFIGTGTGKSPEVARKLINISPENGEYRVELTIKTNNVKEWARFTDEIPADYTAELIEPHNSSFRYENNTAMFDWAQLPGEEEFTVSYLVRSGKDGPPPVINGVLLFGNQNRIKDNISNEEKPVIENIVNNNANNFETKTPVENTQQENRITEQNANQENTVSGQTGSENQTEQVAQNNPVQHQKRSNINSNGVLFKVQISATKRSSVKSSNWFNSKYQINTDVELSYHQGWKKYLIGNCALYREAKVLRSKTQEKIPDAFVVAYDNGMRVDIGDALKRKTINP